MHPESRGESRSVEATPGKCVAMQYPGKRLDPLVSELAVDGIPITMSCPEFKLARVQNYRWLREPVGPAGTLRQQRARKPLNTRN